MAYLHRAAATWHRRVSATGGGSVRQEICIKELLWGLAMNICKGGCCKAHRGVSVLVEALGYRKICMKRLLPGHAKQEAEAAAARPELYLHLPLHAATRQWPARGGALCRVCERLASSLFGHLAGHAAWITKMRTTSQTLPRAAQFCTHRLHCTIKSRSICKHHKSTPLMAPEGGHLLLQIAACQSAWRRPPLVVPSPP